MTISECAVALFIVMKRRDGQNKFGPVTLSGEVVQHRPAGVEFCPGKKKKKQPKGPSELGSLCWLSRWERLQDGKQHPQPV